MRDLVFKELRDCNRFICNGLNEAQKEEGYSLLIATVKKMLELCYIARKEGLLALEIDIDNLEKLHNGKFLKFMILLITDGTDPKLIEEISVARFYSADLQGIEALQYLVMLFGCLAIQAGENPRIIEEKLLVLIPEEASELYRKQREEKVYLPQKQAETESDYLEQFYNGGIAAEPGDTYYFQIKVADYAISSLEDSQIQRVLRDVDNCDVSLAMKGLSGEARRRILNNLSRRIAVMVAADMEWMGTVRMQEVAASIDKIFGVIIKLLNIGEIVSADSEPLCLFKKIFEAEEDKTMERKIHEAENDLYRIMKEYYSMSKSKPNKTVNAPWKNHKENEVIS